MLKFISPLKLDIIDDLWIMPGKQHTLKTCKYSESIKYLTCLSYINSKLE